MNIIGLKYIGKKAQWTDNHVANTGLTWFPGQIHGVPAALIPKFQKHPDIMEVVPITEANMEQVGIVIESAVGGSNATADSNPVLDAVIAQGMQQQAEQKQIEEEILSEPTGLPGNLDKMEPQQIAELAFTTYGMKLDGSQPKERLIEAIKVIASRRG